MGPRIKIKVPTQCKINAVANPKEVPRNKPKRIRVKEEIKQKALLEYIDIEAEQNRENKSCSLEQFCAERPRLPGCLG